jgi:APA family basic amino acid/polyamine antiporter
MARDGLFNALRRVHPVRHADNAISLRHYGQVCLFLRETFGALFTYVGVIITLFSALTVGSVIVLRWKRPELKRPYKLWDYPIVPIYSSWLIVDRLGFPRAKSGTL